VCNETFSPSAADVEFAHKVIAAFDAASADGRGVLTVDGKMIENLHVDEARRVLAVEESLAHR
jgi:citrate lyase subunit beta/citryl-CoA lyase